MLLKRATFIVIIIILFEFYFSIPIKAGDYTLKAKEGQSYTWRITSLEKEEATSLGISPDVEVGDKKKIEVLSIESLSAYWIIEANFWSYQEDLNKKGNETTFKIDKTPEDDDIGLWIIPIPIDEYLKDIEEDLSKEQDYITIENNNSIRIELSGDETYFLYKYDKQTGIMQSLTYYKTGSVVFKSEYERIISGYISFPIIFIISLIGIIFIFKRKELIKKEGKK
ncbi:MAG: hypothetical protein ACTSQJ_02230 [Promethearchaeota archaeon]